MTKREIEMIAAAVRYVQELQTEHGIEILIQELARRLSKDNSKFHPQTFFKLCQPEV